MRLREVMSSPAVTVARGTHLEEVADLLVRHEISAVPTIRRLASLLIRGVPGVVEVRFVEG